jgi:hypothetical protein
MTELDFQILGVGAWGPNFQNWPELSAILNGETLEAHEIKGPKPEVIPANERRRAPLPVRLAVESSWQAVSDAGLDPAELPCVFVSGIGDTQLTDYMCSVLASDNKALSPTKFHNSVHNAAAGYWTISTGCKHAANSVAGFQESVSLAMMEALIQCQAEQRPLLISFYDAPSSEVLCDLLKNDVSFSASIVIAPRGYSEARPNFSAQIRQHELKQHENRWPELDAQQMLQSCYAKNPSAKILSLLKLLASVEPRDSGIIELPLSQQTSLQITMAQSA